MNIPFWKMHGAANDFILVDDRDEQFPSADTDWLARIMARRTGIGSDGLLLIQPSDQADFRMRFFNPDGGEAEMCGNGARCIARLAHELDVAPAEMSFDTVAGLIRAEARGEQVRVCMTDPTDLQRDQVLDIDGEPITFSSINTGVPHVVVTVDHVTEVNIMQLGPAIRYHEAFAPAGTNVNFMSVTGADQLRVRTYERGVENETWACGTGITACGILAGLAGLVQTPVHITAKSGDVICIDYQAEGENITGVTMLGPAVHVCRGVLDYNKA